MNEFRRVVGKKLEVVFEAEERRCGLKAKIAGPFFEQAKARAGKDDCFELGQGGGGGVRTWARDGDNEAGGGRVMATNAIGLGGAGQEAAGGQPKRWGRAHAADQSNASEREQKERGQDAREMGPSHAVIVAWIFLNAEFVCRTTRSPR